MKTKKYCRYNHRNLALIITNHWFLLHNEPPRSQPSSLAPAPHTSVPLVSSSTNTILLWKCPQRKPRRKLLLTLRKILDRARDVTRGRKQRKNKNLTALPVCRGRSTPEAGSRSDVHCSDPCMWCGGDKGNSAGAIDTVRYMSKQQLVRDTLFRLAWCPQSRQDRV